MLSIYKKEMGQYFKSVTGYIFLAIFLAITAYYFTVDNLLAQTSDVKSYFSTMVFTLMFLVPILTMRLFAEEKKSRTDQLLLTAPIKSTKIVAGKFYAALTVLGIGLANNIGVCDRHCHFWQRRHRYGYRLLCRHHIGNGMFYCHWHVFLVDHCQPSGCSCYYIRGITGALPDKLPCGLSAKPFLDKRAGLGRHIQKIPGFCCWDI